MSLNRATSTENAFKAGWVTDFTGLNWPEHAASDCDNIVFDVTGGVTRRNGFDKQPGPMLGTVGTGPARSSYIWTRVDKNTTKSFLVQQIGDRLDLFNISNTITPAGPPVFTLTLPPVTGSTLLSGSYACDYAQAEGRLVVVNGAVNPFYVDMDTNTGVFSVSQINLKVRDFAGMDLDDVEDVRPTTDLATLANTRPDYLYNLFNNGWTSDDLLAWDNARTDMPALSEFKGEYADDDGNFKVGKVKDEVGHAANFGGHFVLDAFNPDRQSSLSLTAKGTVLSTQIVAPNEVNADCEGKYFNLGQTDGTGLDNIVNNPVLGAIGYAAPAISSAIAQIPKPFERATNIAVDVSANDGNDVVIEVYARYTETNVVNAVTAYAFLGYTGVSQTYSEVHEVLLKTVSLTGPVADQTLNIPLPVSRLYNWYWVKVKTGVLTVDCSSYKLTVNKYASNSTSITVGVLNDPERSTFARPQLLTTYNSRIVYAGVSDDKRGTNVYISKTVESKADYSRTYQKNDPTDAFNSQLLANDGLVVKIPDMVGAKALSVMGNDLIILASNGIWAITGRDGGFSAKNFGVRKLTCAPCISACSVVQVNDAPVWWTGSDIVTLDYNVQFHSYQVKSLTEKRINTYIRDLPDRFQRHACGAYDCRADEVYWLYNDGTMEGTIAETDYNRVLILNVKLGAWNRWSGTPNDPFAISQPHVIHPGDRGTDGQVSYLVTNRVTGEYSYGGFTDERHLDWRSFFPSAHPARRMFLSYFETGQLVHGEGARKTRVNFLYTFLGQKDIWGDLRPSIFVQTRYAWATSGISGKFSNKQQAYRTRRHGQSVARSRLRMRGTGEAISVRFESEGEHPFEVIGWSQEELVPAY